MSNQRNPNTVRVGLVIPLDEAARLRTYISNKTVPAGSIGGRSIRKKTRPMHPSDFYVRVGHEVLANIVPNSDSMKWMESRLAANLAKRKEMDESVRKGLFRKIPGVRSKPGRKPGVDYPAYAEAIARRTGKQVTLKTMRASAAKRLAASAVKPTRKGDVKNGTKSKRGSTR